MVSVLVGPELSRGFPQLLDYEGEENKNQYRQASRKGDPKASICVTYLFATEFGNDGVGAARLPKSRICQN